MIASETKTISAEVAPAVEYNYAIGYLRAFLVVLVIAHHAALAYHPYAPPPAASLLAQPRWWEAFPVVDARRWSGFTLLVGFNDVFFMSLMFFVSGLFVWQGLARKHSVKFLGGRLLRLGLPFVAAAGLIAPLAYYPTYLKTAGHTGVAGFWHAWLSLGQWPAGPAWFVWVLLAFDAIAALLFAIAPGWGVALGRRIAKVSGRPTAFFGALVAVAALAYIPMALIFTPISWSSFGPFVFQTSRILHYLLYFLAGVGIGAWGLDQGLLAPGGKLARRWFVWVLRAALLFAAAAVVTIIAATSHAQSQAWAIAMDAGFVLSCAASSFACLAIFVRFVKSRSGIWDSLAANSYGIYLVHYAFVSWLQYALLPAGLPAVAKGAVVLLGALGLSWGAAAAMRRIPAVRRVL